MLLHLSNVVLYHLEVEGIGRKDELLTALVYLALSKRTLHCEKEEKLKFGRSRFLNIFIVQFIHKYKIPFPCATHIFIRMTVMSI